MIGLQKRQVKHVTDGQVKTACHMMHGNPDVMGRKWTNEYLAEIADVPLKVATAKLAQCFDRRLVNYGGTLAGCWWDGD